MGNAMRCEAMRGEGEPQSTASHGPVTVAAEYQGSPNGLLGAICGALRDQQWQLLHYYRCRQRAKLLDEWCIYASYVSYKYIFEICIWLPMWMRLCEWAGNPICGCECYANKWNECELRNDATYLQWITHRVSVVNKTIWCCVRTWRMLNIWTRVQKKISKAKQQTNKRDGTEVQAQEILLPSVFPPHTNYVGARNVRVCTLFLTFWHSISQQKQQQHELWWLWLCDDDDDVGSPITSLLPTIMLKDQRGSHIKNAAFSLFNFS